MATKTRAPTGDGAVTGAWTGVPGLRHLTVNDYPDPNATTLEGGLPASTIEFTHAVFDVPAGSTAISVAVEYYDGEAAAGNNNCGSRIVVGGNVYNAATHNPAGVGGTYRINSWANNPDSGLPWTVDQVNGVGANALGDFGINSTDSNPKYWFASIQLLVTYTLPPISGTLAAVEAADAAALVGTVLVSGSLAATEPGDILGFTGGVLVSGSLAVSELTDDVLWGVGFATQPRSKFRDPWFLRRPQAKDRITWDLYHTKRRYR